jgi:probable phosphoglycerate mutase
VIDHRLDEIDYGAWAGKTSEDIAALPDGAAALDGWSRRDDWPTDAGWVSTEAEILGAIGSFVDEMIVPAGAKEKILVISSNGILRFFPRVLGVANLTLPSYVMKTGHAGLISGVPGAWRVRFWNVSAEALTREHLG